MKRYRDYMCCYSVCKYVNYDRNGKLHFDIASYYRNAFSPIDTREEPLYYQHVKLEFENLMNHHQLLLCSHCLQVDTKENLDNGVVHAAVRCMSGSLITTIYNACSNHAKLRPRIYQGELRKLKETCFLDNKKSKLNKILKDCSHVVAWEWQIKKHRDKVPEWWKKEFVSVTKTR